MLLIPLIDISHMRHRITTEGYTFYDINKIEYSIRLQPGKIYHLIALYILSYVITNNHIKYDWVVYPQ